MCVQYWPAGKNREEVYSGIGVTVESEEQLANFMIRTNSMRKISNILGYSGAFWNIMGQFWGILLFRTKRGSYNKSKYSLKQMLFTAGKQKQ